MTLENNWTKHTKMYSLKATAGGTLFGPPSQPTGCKEPRWNLTTVSLWWMKPQGMAFNITITSAYTSKNHLCCWNTRKGRHFRDVKVFMTHPGTQCKDLMWAKFSKLHNYSTYQCCTSERMHKIDRYIQETEIKGNSNFQSSPQASSLSCCLLCNRCFLSASWIRACSAFARVLALRLWLTPCLLKAPAIMRCATRAFVAGRGAGGSKSGKKEALRRNQWVGQFHHIRHEAFHKWS